MGRAVVSSLVLWCGGRSVQLLPFGSLLLGFGALGGEVAGVPGVVVVMNLVEDG